MQVVVPCTCGLACGLAGCSVIFDVSPHTQISESLYICHSNGLGMNINPAKSELRRLALQILDYTDPMPDGYIEEFDSNGDIRKVALYANEGKTTDKD